MRLVIGQLLTLVRRYPALVDGAFVIIGWVGIKLLVEYLHATGVIQFQISKWLSFGLIVGDLRDLVRLRAPAGPRAGRHRRNPRRCDGAAEERVTDGVGRRRPSQP